MAKCSDGLVNEADAGDPGIAIHHVTADSLEAVVSSLGDAAAAWVAAQGFKAAPGSILQIAGPDGALSAVLFGCDDGKGPEGGPFLAGNLPRQLPAGRYRLAPGFPEPAQTALAWCFGSYKFDRYKGGEGGGEGGGEAAKDEAGTTARLLVPEGVDGDDVRRIADGVQLARDLINTPANDLGPAELAEAARGLAAAHGAEISEIVGDALLDKNFPLIHAVGRAADSDRAPRLIDLTWGSDAHPRVTLVGKGVVFDTGGLDIKPPSAMLLMKKDMGGAANVLGLASMIMSAALPVRLRVLIPAVENAISGNAFRPGDILASRKGLTVEIGNTDAEGRLVLADALTLASEEKPDVLIDMATLTGAARVAVGPDLAPFYCDDEAFAADLAGHAEAVDDPVWRMPLRRRYRALLDSKIADINHISSGPFAGSITAALFLKEFVADVGVWAHFDIYAWVPSARPGRPEGGEAQAIRALYQLLTDRFSD